MLKVLKRLLSLILIIAMSAMLIPADIVSVNALSEDAQVPTQEVGSQLDYSQLQEHAYIVNQQWTNLSQGQNLSYQFRGTTYNETYDPSRHFSSFEAAYSYFESLYTLENGNLKSGISTVTPVFILAPGTYSQPRFTVRYNAIILGNNAGISPNADINIDTANPKSGWAENSARTTATTVNNGFSRSTRVNGSLTDNKYELAARSDGTDEFNIIIDGVDFSASADFLTLEDTSSALSRTMNVTIQNCQISTSNSSLYINDSNSSLNTNNYDFKNIRSVNTKTNGFYGVFASHIRMDGVYMTQSSGNLTNTGSMQKADFSFLMQNSYMYKNSGSYNITFKYTAADHKSAVMINHNLFYEHNSGSYGALVFYSTKTSRNASYTIDIHNNTFIADKSYNTADKNTFLNGNSSYQQGTYTMTVNHNRVIGYTSLFPNMPDNANNIVADFNYNYFAPTYTSHSDVLGTESEYFSSTPYSDPIDIANLIYYEDYAMTIYSGMLDISGVSFYDDADIISIDNDNNLITAAYTCGINIPDPQLYFYDDGTSAAFYSGSDCTNRITSITAPSQEQITTVYAKVTNGSASKKVTVKLYGADASDSFVQSWTDPEGIINSSAYLLAPQTSEMSDGSEYESVWNGRTYMFTVGTNAFASIEDIFEAAGNSVPQIILPYGSYGHLSITKPCQIYGENYESAAAVGDGIFDWDNGFAWSSGKSSKVSQITLSCADVTISGIELTGAFNDTTRTSSGSVTFKNSVINITDTENNGFRTINISNSAVKNAVNSYTLDGIYIKSIPHDSDGSHVLIGGNLPSLLSVINCYADGSVSRLFDSQWNSTLYSWDCSVTVSECRFDGIDMYSSLFTDARDGTQNVGHSIAYTIENNVFKSSSSMSGYVISVSPACYTSLSIKNNIFVNDSSQNTKVLECDYKNLPHSNDTVMFENNRIIGFSGYIGAKNSQQANTPIDASKNYFAEYTEEFFSQASGVHPQGFALCTSYYADYALTQLKNPIDIEFTNKNGLTFDSINSLLELTADTNLQTLDFSDGYIENLQDNVISGTYAKDGSTADITNISLADIITTIDLKISTSDNPYIYSEYTLKIYRQIPDELKIEDIYSDKGQIAYIQITGGYVLTLPETSSDADITVITAQGASCALMLNGQNVNGVSGVESGQSKSYAIRVSNSQLYIDYSLTVLRPASSGISLDYDSYPQTAYIIDSDWSDPSSLQTVSFTYRGSQYTQQYDADRHFASFDAAYSHWLATDPDIIHDTPVFILTAGTYTNITLNYRAIILGTNAGINPNDPDADVSELLPGSAIQANSQWDTLNETVINGSVYRTTRVDGNNVLTLEKTVQDAEAAADEQMQFFLAVDGIKFTGSNYKLQCDDVDIGDRTDNENNISLTVTGYRKNTMYLQNIKSENQTSHIYSAQDTTFNYNSLTVKNLRITGFNSSALIRKYLDTLVFDSVYITDSSMSVSIFDVDGNMNMRHDMDYTIKNSAFVNNSLTRTIRIRTTPHQTGDFEKAELNIYNNAFIETGSAEWGIISVSAQLPGISTYIHDNLFCQLGEYKIKTAIEGNPEFYNNPMTMKVERNRFVGIQSFLPNLSDVSDQLLKELDMDFNNNYFSQTYESASDISGTLPQYISGPSGDYDPIGADSLVYYHDFAMQTLSSDFDITDIKFCGQDTISQIDNNSRTLDVILTQNLTGQLSFTTNGSGTHKVLYRAGSDQPVTQISYTEVLAGNTDYILTVSKNGISKNFSVTLEANEIDYFADTYADPAGEIQNSAYLLDPDVIYKNPGDTYIRNWKNTYYRFTVGENAFPDISQINAVRPDSHIQVIIPDTEIQGELKIPADTSVYGVNYDINPNTPVDSDISSDWTLSPQWGVYGQTEIGSVAIDRNATGTDVSLKGITLRGRFYDTERGISSASTSIVLENIVVEHENLLEESPYLYYSTVYTFTFTNPNNQTGNMNSDTGVMRNIRIEKIMCSQEVQEGRNRLLNEYLPSDFTIDGLYCDLTESNVSLFGWWKLSEKQDDGRLTVKNCNFRNAFETDTSTYLYFEGRNHVNNSQGQTLELNLYDNCFYNFQTAACGFVISPYAYSKINIVGNLFMSTQAKTQQYIRFADTAEYNDVLQMNIFNNRFVGVSGTFNNAPNNTILNLSGNYLNSYSDSFKTAVTTAALTGSNTSNSWHYTNYALTTRSDTIGAFSFTSDIACDNNLKTLRLSLGSGKTTFSLNDYISYNDGNTFAIDSVSDITLVPVANTTYTLTVSKGTAFEQWSLTVSVNPADMSDLYTALDNAAQYTNPELYRDFAYQRLTLCTEEGNRIIHSDTAKQEHADAAAAKINLAADILIGLYDLDLLIDDAKEIDISEFDQQDRNEFNAALNLAINTANNPQSSITDIDQAYLTLENAVVATTFDINEFIDTLNNAESVINSPVFKYYTRASSSELKAKYTTAYDIYYNGIHTMSMLQTAMNELETAIAGLQGNTALLAVAINKAEKISNSTGKYTQSSFASFAQAIETAKTLVNQNPTANQIMDACELLEQLENSLVDLSDYKSALERAQAIDNSDNIYCAPTFNALTQAIAQARAAADNFTDVQQVAQIVEMLDNAMSNLKTHTLSEYSSNNDATCTQDGTKTAHCTTSGCTYESTVTDIGSALGHAWDEGEVTIPATCQTTGVMTYTCQNNPEHTKTEAIPVDPEAHVWDEGTVTKEPTCTEEGEKTVSCTVDGCDVTGEVIKIPALGHEWDEGEVTKEPTCTEEGEMTYHCTREGCDGTKTEPIDIDPDAHAWNEGEVTTAPTCSAEGVKTYTCQNNPEHTKTEAIEIDPEAHDWDEGEVTTEPTCSTEGVKTYTCQNNPAHTETEAIPVDPEAHVWGEYVYNNDATTEADGTETAKCQFCDATDTRTAEGTKLEAQEIIDSSTIFTDIESGRWYKEYVDYVATFKLMNGMTPTTFEPSTTLTRAMFVQILANMSGVDTSDNSVGTVFTDVPAGKWYTPAVKWANENGIVDGMTETTFEPQTAIQRQQICVMVVRYAEKFGIELTADIEKKEFADDSNIQGYAKEAVYICQQAGIVDGKTETEFKPRDNATRAEIATIITRFHQNFVAGK